MHLRAFLFIIAISCFFCGLGQANDIGLPSVARNDENVTNLLEKGLRAWKAEDGRPVDNWRITNGILVNHKPGSHLVTREMYRDFDLSLEFSLPHQGNSGVYLRGRYEIQLYDGNDVKQDKYTGAIWGQIPVEIRAYRGPNVWNELQVRLKGNTVTVLVNRKPVIRSQELKGPTRGAANDNESQPGPILLQSLRGVRFRNILIKNH